MPDVLAAVTFFMGWIVLFSVGQSNNESCAWQERAVVFACGIMLICCGLIVMKWGG